MVQSIDILKSRHGRALTASIGLTLGTLTTPIAHADPVLDATAAAMDMAADPCHDFYQYACGGWIAAENTPQRERLKILGFSRAEADVHDQSQRLLAAAADRYPSGDQTLDLVGAMYKSCMASADNAALDPLQSYLSAIDGVKSAGDFLRVAGLLHQSAGISRLFTLRVLPDVNSQFHTLFLTAGDPGYLDGDIYRKKDRYSKALLAAERDYIVDVLTKLGSTTAAAQRAAGDVLELEAILSRHHSDFAPPRGRFARLFEPGMLSQIDTNVPWTAFFQGLNDYPVQDFFVEPEFIQRLGARLATTSPASLRAYLRWALVSELKNYGPAEFRRNIALGVIYQQAEPERAQACTDWTTVLLPDPVGRILSRSDSAQARVPTARRLLRAVRKEFGRRIPGNPWLTPEAETDTVNKLNALISQVGYPVNEWQDYTDVSMSTADFLGNAVTARRFAFKIQMQRYGTPVSRKAWSLPIIAPEFAPQDVNALYAPGYNKVYLLAGMLRPPFLDAEAPMPMNLAGIGYIAAHEVMHGFNEFGRRLRADGSLGDLWSDTVNAAFEARSQCVIDQYSRYRVGQGVRVNGARTLEENLADVFGLKLSFRTFRRNRANQPSNYALGERLVVTPEQLFFIAYAQNYCAVSQPGVLAYQSSRSWRRYPPPRYRAIGPLVNERGFANAFGCPVGTPMNPVTKCRIW